MAAYKKGDVIMRCAKFAGLPTLTYHEHRFHGVESQMVCLFCFRSKTPTMVGEGMTTLKRCTACRVAGYCSVECQRADWRDVHRDECPFLKRALETKLLNDAEPNALNSTDRHLARCLIRVGRVKNVAKNAEVDAAEKQLVERYLQLDSHANDKSIKLIADVHADFYDRMLIIRRYLNGNAYLSTLSNGEIVEHECRRRYYSAKFPFIAGSVICLELADIVHACDPSASAVLRDDGFVRLVANRDIASDDDISLSYTDNLMTTDRRRLNLRQSFGIECECSLCDTGGAGDSSPTRDDYLRSIRCWSAFGLEDYEKFKHACSAPCPLTVDGVPAAEKCANGHAQTYSKKKLAVYRQTMEYYEGLMDHRVECKEDRAEWDTLQKYWHPINCHTLLKPWTDDERHETKCQHLFKRAWHGAGLRSFFIGDTINYVACYNKWVGVEPATLYARLFLSLQWLKWGAGHNPMRPPIELEMCAKLIGELGELAKFLHGKSRRTVLLAKASRMAPAKLQEMANHYEHMQSSTGAHLQLRMPGEDVKDFLMRGLRGL